jgi:PPK2 family polyphosphate:nucleotide phosphotransferase
MDTAQFRAEPGKKIRLEKIDPSQNGKPGLRDESDDLLQRDLKRIDAMQYLLYADAGRSLLIVLQGPDASGKDGVIRHLFSCTNPMGISVARFEKPTPEEAGHDFLWRVHARTPRKGQITIFNRSHYEDVLVPRVHGDIDKRTWKQRYDQINEFEELLTEQGTCVLKFFLHISAEEQLERFRMRLEDKDRQWKISESDYTERALWTDYQRAYEGMIHNTSTKFAPWHVIPANHKWFRNLVISRIICEALEDFKLKAPKPRVDIAAIAAKYHKLADKAVEP